MKVVGIDPGLSGALWVIIGELGDAVTDMPRTGFHNSKSGFVDGLAVAQWLSSCKPDLIVIEMVGSRPGQGVSSTFKFGAAYGGVVSVCLAYPCEVVLVSPTVWKRHFGLIGTVKDAARLKALNLVPHMAHKLKRKKDGGRADAALIALYGRQVLSVQKLRKKR
jgi:crossover junction endodeoxyribonuclease RuvC